MNHMEEVAKMLGVEMGEEFKMAGFWPTFFISYEGLQSKENNGSDKDEINFILLNLLLGKNKIIKLPFKPKEGETYWFWRKFASDENGKTVWYLDAYDDYFEPCYTIPTINYMLGNCYLTKQECLADTAMKARIEKMERCKW